MNYQIIKDEDKLNQFIDWLPELQENETFYYCLFARNKYVKGTEHEKFLKADKCQLKRGTSKKDFLYDKIKQLEIEIGSYKTNGYDIPQEALALYINPNPRSEVKAMKLLLTKGLDLILNQNKGFSCKSEALSAIQQSCSRKLFMDFDFDNMTPEEIYENICTNVQMNRNCIKRLKTRGGCHVLVEVDKVNTSFQKNWYQQMTKLPGLDVTNHTDCLLPVPGCCQGGFIPYFL